MAFYQVCLPPSNCCSNYSNDCWIVIKHSSNSVTSLLEKFQWIFFSFQNQKHLIPVPAFIHTRLLRIAKHPSHCLLCVKNQPVPGIPQIPIETCWSQGSRTPSLQLASHRVGMPIQNTPKGPHGSHKANSVLVQKSQRVTCMAYNWPSRFEERRMVEMVK